MKKNYASLFLGSLVAVFSLFALYNCRDHETPPPIPDFGNELSSIVFKPVSLIDPAPVTSQPGTFTAPTDNTVGSYGGGTPPQSMQNVANTVGAALTPAQLNALNAITPAQLQAIANGGELPADLQTALNILKGNPALAGFFAAFTLPSVNGTTVNGRTGLPEVPEAIEKVTGVQAVDDACVKAAEDALANALDKMRADAKTQQDQVEAQYAASVAAANTAFTACETAANSYSTQITATQTRYNALLVILNNNQVALGNFYAPLRALVMVQYASELAILNTLKKAEAAACTKKKEAALANALAAKNENKANVTAALNTGLTTARNKIKELILACHNQGGGK